jgi:hypothetical protein
VFGVPGQRTRIDGAASDLRPVTFSRRIQVGLTPKIVCTADSGAPRRITRCPEGRPICAAGRCQLSTQGNGATLGRTRNSPAGLLRDYSGRQIIACGLLQRLIGLSLRALQAVADTPRHRSVASGAVDPPSGRADAECDVISAFRRRGPGSSLP